MDWFSWNTNVWDNYKKHFNKKKNIRCLEIASFEGRSTVYIAQNYCNGTDSCVDAVDPWSDDLALDAYKLFLENTKTLREDNKIIINKGFSSEIFMTFLQEVRSGKRQKYDFIYIDGCHTAKDVLMDAVLSWELLNINGIMIFDDYEWGLGEFNDNMTPKPAVNGFMETYQGLYKLLFKDYQVHLQKLFEAPILLKKDKLRSPKN